MNIRSGLGAPEEGLDGPYQRVPLMMAFNNPPLQNFSEQISLRVSIPCNCLLASAIHSPNWIWLLRLCVVNHPLEVHNDHGLISHNPRIVTRGKKGNISGLALELSAIVHTDL